jgi:hypothetical protein
MTFPINSTSVMTLACERVCRVMQRVAREGLISYGGVFSCRKIAGTNYWSQHAWGNALDLFPKESKYNDEIAEAAVTQATKRTFANRGRKLDLSNVIDHLNSRIWTPGTVGTSTTARWVHTCMSRRRPSRPVPRPVREGRSRARARGLRPQLLEVRPRRALGQRSRDHAGSLGARRALAVHGEPAV